MKSTSEQRFISKMGFIANFLNFWTFAPSDLDHCLKDVLSHNSINGLFYKNVYKVLLHVDTKCVSL